MKETIEALVGVIAVAREVAVLAKDGVQVSDAVALAAKIAQDEAFRNKLLAAAEGVQKIPTELTPITLEKMIALVIGLSAEFK